MVPKPHLALSFAMSAALIASPAIAQTVAEGGRPFTVSLTGAAEAPGPGDPDGSGTAWITLNHGQQRVCFEFSVMNVDGITAAHIHEAPVGEPGAVVVPLFSGGLDEEGCVENVDRALIKDIMQNPGDYYVNVHSTAFPAGAVRGQMSK